MNWIWIISYLLVIYTIGLCILNFSGIKKDKVWFWFIISWGVWFMASVLYYFFILTPDFMSDNTVDLKLHIDYLWLSSIFFPVHHILFLISIIVLIVKKIRNNPMK